jgi:hypothetical protein
MIAFVGAAGALLLSSAGLAANTALVGVSRIDDFFYPGKQFSLWFELELDVTGIGGVTATVGGSEYLMELYDGYWETDEIVFDDLAAMKTAAAGEWTIDIAGSSPSESTFTLDAASFSDSDFFATATNLSPAEGAVGVASDTLLSWTDPTGEMTPYVLVASVGNDFGGDQEVMNLEGQIETDATSWQPAEALQNGFNEFGVFYGDANSSFITALSVSSGAITWSSHAAAPDGYPASTPLLALGSETIVSFTVPEPSPELARAAALSALALLARRRRPIRARGKRRA